MKKLLLGMLGIAILLCCQIGQAEEPIGFNWQEIFKPNPMQAEENELFIIRKTAKFYGLTEEDIQIIIAIRKFYINDLTLNKNTALGIFLATFTVNITQMIDWACIHFKYIREKYNTLAMEIHPDYVDFVLTYFWDLIAQKFSIGTQEQMIKDKQPISDFIHSYMQAHWEK